MWLPSALLCAVFAVHASTSASAGTDVVAKWKAIEANAKSLVQKLISMSYREALPLIHEADLSSECFISLTSVLRGLQELNTDVVRLLDASGKIPSGFSDGSLAELGDYDLCLRLVVHKSTQSGTGEELFRGQYCSFTLDPPLPPRPPVIRNTQPLIDSSSFANHSVIKETLDVSWGLYTTRLRMGICVPDQCSPPEIHRMLQAVSEKLLLSTTLLGCEVRELAVLNNSQIASIVILGSFIMIVLAATFCDIVLGCLKDQGRYNTMPGESLQSFLKLSLPRVTYELFKVGNSNASLKVFNGLRICGVFWVVAFHTYIYPDIGTYRALRELQKNAIYIPFQFINNAWLCVDMFFFISGFLIVYNQRKMPPKVSSCRFYVKSLIQRYWRLIPLAMLVMLILFLEPLFGSGPIWKAKMNSEVRNCELHWWSVLGGFSNFFHVDDACIIHFWYISADLQIYAAAVALSLLSIKKRRLSIVIMLACVVASMVTVGVQTYLSEYPPTMSLFARDVKFTLTMNRWMYLLPHAHVGPYFLGALTAFAYERYRQSKIPVMLQSVLWALSLLFIGASLFAAAPWGLGDLPPLHVTIAYASTHRIAWALGLAWIVFACATGKGGVVNSLLSWDALVPLGRMSYSIYLVHAYLVFYKAWTIRQRIENHHFQIMSSAVSNFMMAIAAGYLVYVFLEQPLVLAWAMANKRLNERATEAAANAEKSALPVIEESQHSPNYRG
ncbi:nose resistant to fluoxetine protein 6-like [Dermacentor variabilis]|uniref:nose resistant to fluoxetine protein 6-like n=1 Tax=Dermacentor variabilis TaxID=34621 RepID=UPI003F5C5731